MSDKEALLQFQRKRVSSDMVQYLVEVTSSLIKVKPTKAYPSPPASPSESCDETKPLVSLYEFIRRLIHHSNVQTPTLMSTLVYLARLKTVLPSNVYGIESTRHRIFLGSLILSAKFLNDSSPINKHWAAYTDGLLSIEEVNTIERELLDYLNWDLSMTNEDLIKSLSHFLIPIKFELQTAKRELILKRQKQYERSISAPVEKLRSMKSYNSLKSSSSINSINSTVPSLMSASSSRSTLASLDSATSIQNMLVKESIDEIDYYKPTMPLRVRSDNDSNKAYLTKSRKTMNLNDISSIVPQIAVPQISGCF